MTSTSNIGEAFDESAGLVTMPILILSLAPGFLLCVPAVVFVLFPVIAVGVVAAAGALVVAGVVTIVAVPVLVARALVHRTGHALATVRGISSRPEPDPAMRLSPSR